MLLLHALRKLPEVPGACFIVEVHISAVRLCVIKVTKLKTENLSYKVTKLKAKIFSYTGHVSRG